MKRFGSGLQAKFLFSLVLMTCVTVALITAVIAVQYRARMERAYSEQAFGMATYAASFIDGAKTREYYTTGKTDAYHAEVQNLLMKAKQAMGLSYFYVVVPEKEKMVYVYDADAATPDAEDAKHVGDSDEYYGDGDRVMHEAFSPDSKHAILITRNDEYGYLASAYVPILDKSRVPVALASVDISMDMIDAQIRQMILLSTLLSLAVMVVCIAAYYFFMRRAVIHPLNLLAHAARDFTSSRERTGELAMNQVKISSKDEIGDLCHAMTKMELDLNQYMVNLKAATAERERIGAELNIAMKIQADMLPRSFPAFPNRKDFDIYATMTPTKEVGGDFYDFFLVDETHLALVIADVSGKGVPAALFMAIARTMIKNRTLVGGSPSEILFDVNNQLCEGNASQFFVTVWLGILDLKTGKGVAANAGHEHPIVSRKDGDFELVVYRHGPAVATLENMKFREHEFELHPGDTLFVYTDGVPEATNAANVLYGTDRLLKAMNANKSRTLKDLLEAVHADVNAFVGDAPQFDDLTMLALRFDGPNP